MSLIARDKKRDRAGLRMVLLQDFGAPVVRHVSVEDLWQGLDEIGVATTG
jgi:3-dehydroquinate synthetase